MGRWKAGSAVGAAVLAAAAQAPAPAKRLQAVRIPGPIRLDGRLDEAAWAQAPAADGFTQVWPAYGEPSGLRTEVKVLYDDKALYIGARMWVRPEEGPVVRRLHRRDQESQSSWFGVFVDSLHDHRSALGFHVNAAGVQRDEVRFDDVNSDGSWDGVWESEVSTDETGWTAEMRIPFSLLRVNASDGPQSWGINFSRQDQGKVRQVSQWAVPPRGENAFVSRFPDLVGIEGVRPQPRRELVPYLSARRKFETAAAYDDRKWQGRAGLDARAGLTSHSQVDVTLHPDFGQVEVDQAVLNLSTIETFFPEKRPFFLEGSEIFQVAGPQLFYSRRIGRGVYDPSTDDGSLAPGEVLVDRPDITEISAAAKYTAKYGTGTNVGLLAANEEPVRFRVRGADGVERRRDFDAFPSTTSAVLRIQQRVDDRGSYLGMFSSYYHQAATSGREAKVGAVDGAWTSRDRSFTFNSTLTYAASGPRDGETLRGWRGRFQSHKEWGGQYLDANVLSAGRDYDPNDLGYLGRADQRQVFLGTGHRWDRTYGVFRNLDANVGMSESRDQAGRVFQRDVRVFAKTDFTNYWTFWINPGLNLPVDDDRELRTFRDPTKKYLRRGRIPVLSAYLDTSANKPWFGRLEVSRAWFEGGPSTDTTFTQVIRPSSALEILLECEWNRQEGELRWMGSPTASLPGGGTADVPVVGLRALNQYNQVLRVAYAFSPRLTVQMFSQWLDANWAFRDPRHYVDDRTLAPGLPAGIASAPAAAESWRTWNLNLITRWEFRPGSTAFFVYTHGVQTDQLVNDRGSLSPRPDLALLRHLPSDDVMQVKVSWLFR